MGETWEEETGPGLRIGDCVSIFSPECFGFLMADGFADDALYVNPINPKDLCPHEFESCVFKLQVKMTYVAKEKVHPDGSHFLCAVVGFMTWLFDILPVPAIHERAQDQE